MDWGMVVLMFLHIGGGAVWLGASMFANFALLPYIARQPAGRRRDAVSSLVLAPERLIIGAALLAALSGVVLGLGYRGFTTLESLSTPAGIVFLVAIGVAVLVFAVGGRMTSPAARRLVQDPDTPDEMDSLLAQLRTGFRIELAGIAAILALMILLPRL
jgi:uncharacterized membrane protein